MLEREREEYLEEIYELVKENNKLLRAQKRARIFSGLMRVLWFAIVIGVPIWLYYTYLQPVVGNLQDSLLKLENLSNANPALGKQVEPIIQTVKTLMGMFGAGQ